MIGHALIHTRHPVHPLSERWVAAGFGIGSVCFIVGPFPGFVELVGERADATVFFVGSLFFTSAAGPRRSPTTSRRRARRSRRRAGCTRSTGSA